MIHNENKPLILACIDGGALSQAVVHYSIWLAKTLEIPLGLIHVIEHSQPVMSSDFSGAIGLGASEDLLTELASMEQTRARLLRRKGQLMLETAQQQAQSAGLARVEVYQRHGTLAEHLVEMEHRLHLVVVGVRGESSDDDERAVGAQLEALIRAVHRPFFVVNRVFEAPKTFLFAYDGGSASERALDFLQHTQQLQPFHWILAHAHAKESTARILDPVRQTLQQQGFRQLHLEYSEKKPEDALVALQHRHKVDVTVMGAFSHHPLRGFIFGSFTEKMLRKTRQPLLLIAAD